MPGEGLTHGPPAERYAGGRYHRCSRSTGIPCATVLPLIRALPGDRLDCPRPHDAKHHRVATTRVPRVALGASTGAPGPHDFTSVSMLFVGMIETTLQPDTSIASPPHVS